MERIIGRIDAHKPAPPSVPVPSLDNIQAGSRRQSYRLRDIHPDDDVISGQRQRGFDPAALDPSVLPQDDPTASDPGIDDDVRSCFRIAHLGAHKAPAALDQVLKRAEMEETEPRHHVDAKRNCPQSSIDGSERSVIDPRSGRSDLVQITGVGILPSA
jgi:hypothetical protein